MKFEKININKPIKKVLVAPLDWGLGHSTRCIPIIYDFLSLNIEVLIAAEGQQKNLLQKELPQVKFLPLQGYKIGYSKNKHWFWFTLLLQLPKLFYRIYQEHKWLKKIIRQHNIDMVVSDNRLGLFNIAISSVYITHQLKIKTGFKFTEWLLQKIHYFFINKYTACWVPDNEEEDNLAGELSHPEKLPKIPLSYLGPLSRLAKKRGLIQRQYNCMFIISGPEPQRSIFEKIVLAELKTFNGNALLVRGLPGDENLPLIENSNIEIKNHLSAQAMSAAIQQSEIIISRSGYTTIMDLSKLQQKAILVPTPGQTEQEYLATYLMHKKVFFSIDQDKFSLNETLKKVAVFNFKKGIPVLENYKKVIREFIDEQPDKLLTQ
jgi:uncharacterized protein (TIGR00661 family)